MYSTMDSVDDALNSRPHILDGKEVDPKRAVPKEDSGSGASTRVKKVFVGGISPDTTEDHMQEYFSSFGRVESVSVITDKETGKSRGFGFVTYFDYDPVDKICSMRTHEVNGQQCEVKKAQAKADEMGRSGGGGRAIKKYGFDCQLCNNSGESYWTCIGGRGGRGGGGRMPGGGYGGMAGGYGGGGYGGGGYGAGSGGYGAYGGYGAAGWGQADGGYGSPYGSSLGSGYADGYGGGAMKGSAYAAKAPGPYGGGYGTSSAYSAAAYGGGYGAGYGAPAGGGYGGGGSAYGGGGYGGYGSAGY